MDGREIFDRAMQLKNVLPSIHQNNAAMAALDNLIAAVAVEESPFVYSADFTAANGNALAGGATGTVVIPIQQDAAFRIMAGVYFADIAAAIQTDSTRVIPICTVTLQDTGSGRFLTDRPVPLSSMFGEGDKPFWWPTPFVMPALSSLQVQLVNLTAATTYNIRVNFIGIKLSKFARRNGL